jgi:hypothetical protein
LLRIQIDSQPAQANNIKLASGGKGGGILHR